MVSYKTKIFVLPIGYEIGYYITFGGSVDIITLFQSSIEWHKSASSKCEDIKQGVNDGGKQIDKFPGNQEILCDKAYNGLQNELRVICPEKSK